MKRHHDREGRSRSKRSRSSYDRMHDDDGSRLSRSPEFDRRESSGRSRRDLDYDYEPGRKTFRDERSIKDSYPSEGRTPAAYRSLCIFNFSRKIPDHLIKDALGHEFHKFGEFNIKVQCNSEDKVAYLNFRYPDDAKIAKHTVGKSKLILFDIPVRIDSVYNKRRSASPPPRSPPPRSPPPRSPPPDHRDRRDLYMPHGPISPPLRPPMAPPLRRGPPHPPMPPMPPPPGRHMGPPPPNMGRDFGPPGPPPPGPPHLQGPPGPPPHHHPHPRDFPGPGFPPDRRPPIGNEKFPFHLNHVDPEDDEKATRTLFIGNLDINIDEEELRHIFEKYGFIEEIDIKRPVRGAGNAYCFMKYVNLDCAHRAKVEMSGKLIGRFQCKIGYGKATPTNCLWVGGLGPWVTREMLECEFDRFGLINTIDWQPGKSYAYLLYDSNDAASAAIQDMRGFPLGGPDRRIRVDFTDAAHINNMPSRPPGPPRGEPFPPRNFPGPHVPPPPGPPGHGPWRGPHPPPPPPGLPPPRDWHGPGREPPPYRRPDNPRPFDRRGPPEPADMHSRRPRSPDNDGRDRRNIDRTKGPGSHDGEIKRGHEENLQNGKAKIEVEPSTLNVDNIGDLSAALPVAWNGAMILKNNAFPARMHVVSGDVSIVDNLMRDPTSTETPVLKVTQRLRLDPPKLEDVRRRVNSGIPTGHCILLALPGTLLNYDDPSGNTQQRPLKNLISYLNKKEAAGVISLPPNPTKDNKDNVGILYSFPPSPFGQSFLQKKAPRLPSTPSKDDHLVVVVVRGAV